MKNLLKQHYDYFILGFSIIVSAILRIVVPFGMVFQNGKVIYNAADAYYHMRFVDLMLANFPRFEFSDPYLHTNFGIAPLWDLMIVWFGKVFDNANIVAAYLPAILGILTLIPIFIIAKRIFKNKLIISVSVVFGAIVSGLFYARTQLGAADHHALEIFLLTMAMMWLIMLLSSKDIVVKGIYFFLALLMFYSYYLTWGIPGIICSVTIVCFSVYSWGVLKLWNSHKKWFKCLVGFPVVAIAILLLSHAGYFGYLGNLVKVAIPLNFDSSIAEGQPLFFSYSSVQNVFLDLSIVWGYFGILFFAMLVGIGMLLYRVIKHERKQDIILLAWTVVILIMTLVARRWAYYLAVNVVILSSFSLVVIIKALVKVKGKIKVKRLVVASVVGVAFIIVPFIRNDVGIAQNEYNYPTKGWQEVSTFLRGELIESEDAQYYKASKDLGNGVWYVTKAWGDNISSTIPVVLSWWDYGYYLVRESHMKVISHPGGLGHEEAAKLLLSKDADIVNQLKELNVKYIVIDSKMAVEYFYAIVELAGENISQYYVNDSEMVVRTPQYYETLLAQLYLFNNVEGINLVYASNKISLAPIGTASFIESEVKVFKVE